MSTNELNNSQQTYQLRTQLLVKSAETMGLLICRATSIRAEKCALLSSVGRKTLGRAHTSKKRAAMMLKIGPTAQKMEFFGRSAKYSTLAKETIYRCAVKCYRQERASLSYVTNTLRHSSDTLKDFEICRRSSPENEDEISKQWCMLLSAIRDQESRISATRHQLAMEASIIKAAANGGAATKDKNQS